MDAYNNLVAAVKRVLNDGSVIEVFEAVYSSMENLASEATDEISRQAELDFALNELAEAQERVEKWQSTR